MHWIVIMFNEDSIDIKANIYLIYYLMCVNYMLSMMTTSIQIPYIRGSMRAAGSK